MTMILVDTSIWIDHFRSESSRLAPLLHRNQVMIHPMLIGELACGNLRNRSNVLSLLQGLPKAPTATDDEVLFFIERHQLMGRGIGYVDAHLLAASALDQPTLLWTGDRRLMDVAAELRLAYSPSYSE